MKRQGEIRYKARKTRFVVGSTPQLASYKNRQSTSPRQYIPMVFRSVTHREKKFLMEFMGPFAFLFNWKTRNCLTASWKIILTLISLAADVSWKKHSYSEANSKASCLHTAREWLRSTLLPTRTIAVCWLRCFFSSRMSLISCFAVWNVRGSSMA